MRIAVDATCWHNQRGYGRHGRSLLSALAQLDRRNHYTFFIDSAEDIDTLPSTVEVHLVQSGAPTAVAAASNGHRSLKDMLYMSRALSSARADTILFPTVYSYVPVVSRARKIVFIHDIIAEKFPQLTLPSRSSLLFWKIKVALGRRQADAIVTVSEYSRQQIVDYFHLSPERVFVSGEASDPVFQVLEAPQQSGCLSALGIPDQGRLVVYVGGFGPHKNLEALVREFSTLCREEQFADTHMVMVGEYQKEVFHSHFSTIRRIVEELGIQSRVTFTGFLPDEELVVLLNRSTVLVLPSLMEGFGLPAVEAAACGLPVIATRESPLPELLGEGGLYIDPYQPAQLQACLREVLASPSLRQKMGASALAAASKLTWENSARQMLSILSSIV